MRHVHLVLGIVLLTLPTWPAWAEEPAKEPVEVLFSPKGGCTQAVIKEIEQAKSSIRIQARSFTSASIAKSLVEAKGRNVDVVVLLDATCTTDNKCVAPAMIKDGVTVLVDARHKVANSRNIIVDEQVILTGSFELTPESELSNEETLVILRDQKKMAARFVENFNKHKEESVAFKPAAKPPAAAENGVSEKGEKEAAKEGTKGSAKTKTSAGQEIAAQIDPNTATEAQLMQIKGLGPTKAKAIIAYREAHGGQGKPAFTRVEDLEKVKGIGKATAAKLAPYFTFPAASDQPSQEEKKESKETGKRDTK